MKRYYRDESPYSKKRNTSSETERENESGESSSWYSTDSEKPEREKEERLNKRILDLVKEHSLTPHQRFETHWPDSQERCEKTVVVLRQGTGETRVVVKGMGGLICVLPDTSSIIRPSLVDPQFSTLSLRLPNKFSPRFARTAFSFYLRVGI